MASHGRGTTFCSALLPNTNRNMGQRSKLDTYLDHNRENPAARVELYLTHWRTTRHNILKVSEEIQRTQDPDVLSQLKGRLDELGSDLFCDVFKYFNAKTALMRQASERNLMISQCYICHIMSEGLKKEDVCSAFEKTKYINFDAIGGDNSDAETITEKDSSAEDSKKGAETKPTEKEGETAPPGGALRFRSTRSKVPKETKMNMVNQFGFQPAEKYSCNGRVVMPEQILEKTIENHVKANRGASMTKDVCFGLYDTYVVFERSVRARSARSYHSTLLRMSLVSMTQTEALFHITTLKYYEILNSNTNTGTLT